MDETYAERLQAKLAPDAVARALIQAGALLTGYELVKASILDGVRGSYTFGFDENGLTVDPEYDEKVLSRNPSAFVASVGWLVERGALQQKHVDALEAIRAHRHVVAHELARLLVDPDAEIEIERLADLRDCMRALDRFWGGIEVDIHPDVDAAEVDHDGIRSGPGLLLDYLLDMAGVVDPGRVDTDGQS